MDILYHIPVRPAPIWISTILLVVMFIFWGTPDDGNDSTPKDRTIQETVETMKKADLKEGDYVKTEGYYSPGDGGNAEYIIKKTEDPDDDGSVINLKGDLQAHLVHDGAIKVKWFGAKGDNSHNDTEAFKKAISAAEYLGTVEVQEGTYKITEPLDVRSRRFIGVGKDKTTIIQYTAKEPILIAGEVHQYISDLTIRHIDRSVLTEEAPNGVGINIQRMGYGSVIERVDIQKVTSAIYSNESLTQGKGNYLFSSTIRDITVSDFSHSVMYIRGSNTGSIFSNIYASNWDDTAKRTYLKSKYGVYMHTNSNGRIEQLNLEHGYYRTGVELVDSVNFIIDGIHAEGYTFDGDNSSLIKARYHSNIQIRGISLTFSKFDGERSKSSALFQLSDDSTIEVSGMVVNGNQKLNNPVLRRLIAGGQLEEGISLQLNNTKVLDGTFVNKDYVDSSYNSNKSIVITEKTKDY